ncbi:MAG: ABC transporter ATP-binding protein [Candidatus Limiplasma sp.]|nr:ABC transporter ATP-binding protein [Candidatus Limiplasma sp.]
MTLLEMRHVTKRFGPVVANEDVSLTVERGEVHALLGENGAGKSTLMNILYGMYTQSEGEILYNGKPVRIRDPKQAIELGIGMVHQHFMLIPALTAIENVVLGYAGNREVLDLKAAAARFTEMAARYNMNIDPWCKVEQLSVGQQQRLEILKALFRNVELMILDEPTAVLTPQEVEGLFEMIRQLTREGKTVIFISHKLNEIMTICDRCTVLRLGRVVASGIPTAQITDKEQLASLMVGKSVDLMVRKEPSAPGKTVLEVKRLCCQSVRNLPAVRDVSFTLREGEILSICGVDGNGQSELVKAICGLLKPTGGQVVIDGEDMAGKPLRDILKCGVSHIPEDRHKMGMVARMNIRENLTLMSYDQSPFSRRGVLRWRWIDKHSAELCARYNVKTPSVSEFAGNLSGGNQQKFVVGRELDRKPRLLVAVHPSRGLDIGATKYIQSRIVQERDRGAAVLLVSTELDEILEISDRILVLYEGEVMGIVDQKDATRNGLGLMMAGERAEKQE